MNRFGRRIKMEERGIRERMNEYSGQSREIRWRRKDVRSGAI